MIVITWGMEWRLSLVTHDEMLFADMMWMIIKILTSLADAPVHAQIFLRAGQMAALDKLRTDLLNASAVTLQRHARGFVLRRRYARARRAAVTLQARPAFQGLGAGDQVCARAACRRHAAGARRHAPQELCAVMQERGHGPLKAHARSFLLHSAFFCVHQTAFVQQSSAAAAALLPSPVSSREECHVTAPWQGVQVPLVTLRCRPAHGGWRRARWRGACVARPRRCASRAPGGGTWRARASCACSARCWPSRRRTGGSPRGTLRQTCGAAACCTPKPEHGSR